MEKLEVINRPLMDQDEFTQYLQDNRVNPVEDIMLGRLHLSTYEAVSKYKSIGRAIRRGLVALNGLLIPKRPFNNRRNTSKRKHAFSRSTNEYKKQLYGQFNKRLTI